MRLAEPIGSGVLPVPHNSVVSQTERASAASNSEASTNCPLPELCRPITALSTA